MIFLISFPIIFKKLIIFFLLITSGQLKLQRSHYSWDIILHFWFYFLLFYLLRNQLLLNFQLTQSNYKSNHFLIALGFSRYDSNGDLLKRFLICFMKYVFLLFFIGNDTPKFSLHGRRTGVGRPPTSWKFAHFPLSPI